MSFDTELRAYWLSKSAITAIAPAARVHQSNVPEAYAGAYLWYSRAGIDRADTLDMTTADNVDPWEQRFDVEAISEDQGEAIDLGSVIESLHGDRGNFGAGQIQGVFVEDQIEGYVPRGVMSDKGLEVAALVVVFIGYTPP